MQKIDAMTMDCTRFAKKFRAIAIATPVSWIDSATAATGKCFVIAASFETIEFHDELIALSSPDFMGEILR